MALIKHTTNLDLAIINFLGAQTFNFIFEPLALIFLLIGWLLIFTLTMELPIHEITDIDRAINKNFISLSVGVIVTEVTLIEGAIRVTQLASTLLDAITPLTFILGVILPLTSALAIHFALLPVTTKCPAPLLTQEGAMTLLISIFEAALIEVPIYPLSSTVSTRVTLNELTNINFILRHVQLANAFHLTIFP